MDLSEKVAIVAGAGGGMGLTIANDLLAAGARVALLDIKNQPQEICSQGGRAAYFQGDVTEPAFVAEAVRETVSSHGQLNYLVNATGVLWFDRDTSAVDMDLDVWDRVLAVNLKSAVLTSRYAIAEMRKAGGGALVHIASIDALRGDNKPQDAYGASKAALLRLSKSLAIQFAGDGIRSNAILPGPVMSPMQNRWKDDPNALLAVAESIPLGRIGTTRDIANACLFLLSDAAAFVTGAELIVDGGCTAKP